MLRIVVDADVPDVRLRGRNFGFASLKISGKVRRESTGDLHADEVAGEKGVAGKQTIQI